MRREKRERESRILYPGLLPSACWGLIMSSEKRPLQRLSISLPAIRLCDRIKTGLHDDCAAIISFFWDNETQSIQVRFKIVCQKRKSFHKKQ